MPKDRSRQGQVLLTIVAGLPLAWVLAVHVSDLARVLIVGLALYWLLGRTKAPASLMQTLPATRLVRVALRGFVCVFMIYTATQPLLEARLGRHGIDFAIFTQVIDSISRRGAPLTSLIGWEWRNFLAHHFSPILYIPGGLGFVGVPAYVAASVCHAVAIASAGLALWLSARELGLPRHLAWLAVALLCANPTFSHGVLYGVHDELYALPFLGFAYYFWLGRRIPSALLCLLATMLAKESLFPVVTAFALMMIADSIGFWDRERRAETRMALSPWQYAATFGVGGFGALCFATYAFLPRYLWDGHFDHADKLMSLAELGHLEWVVGKLWFVVFLGLPVLWYPLWRRAHWHLTLPAWPLIGFVLLSRFDQMWKPLNYYGVIPSYVLMMAACIAWSRTHARHGASLPAFTAALLLALAFSWNSKKPLKLIAEAISQPHLDPDQLAMIPSDARVIATPAATLMLLRAKIVWRLAGANRVTPSAFDYVVVLQSEAARVGPELKALSHECHASEIWHIRCRSDL